MKLAIVERVRDVKDRILTLLDVIKESEDTGRANDDRILLLVAERADDLCRQLSGLSQVIDQNGNHLREYLAAVRPTNEEYNYSPETIDYRLRNPEIALAQHLRAFLPSRVAVDVGANVGNVCELLLSAGYQVHAFEPNREVFGTLCQRLQHYSDFTAHAIALGVQDGEQTLFTAQLEDGNGPALDPDSSVYSTLVQHPTPGNLQLKSGYPVSVRTLRSLHQKGVVPPEVGLLKIDTEGNDLEVLKGSKGTYHVVMAEFWDKDHFFSDGEIGSLSQLAAHMRSKGHNWHIVIFRSPKCDRPRFFCNIDQSVKGSWGNVIFFRDYQVFREAHNWCRANLPQNETYV